MKNSRRRIILLILASLLILVVGFESFHFSRNKGNVILYVSSQTSLIDTTDITLLVDGKEIFSDTFTTGNFHNYKEYSLKLSPLVLHEIVIYSEKAKAKLVYQTRLCFVNWVLLNLWDEGSNFEPTLKINDESYIETKKKSPMYWFTIEKRKTPVIFM